MNCSIDRIFRLDRCFLFSFPRAKYDNRVESENFGEKRREIYINSRSFSGIRDNLVVRDDGSLPKRIMLGKEIVALLASHCCSPDGFVIDRY